MAPDNHKSEVQANFGHNIEEFHLRMAATFVSHEQLHLDNIQNIDYRVHEPCFKTNRTKRHNNAGWHENQNKFVMTMVLINLNSSIISLDTSKNKVLGRSM